MITKAEIEKLTSTQREFLYYMTINLGWFKLDQNKNYVMTQKGIDIFEESARMHGF